MRALAHQLDTQATRAHEIAEQNVADYSNQGQRFLGELHHFAEAARDVHTRADAEVDVVNTNDIGPIVNHLFQDARRVDRDMRGARVFTQVWDEWSGGADPRRAERLGPLLRYEAAVVVMPARRFAPPRHGRSSGHRGPTSLLGDPRC